MARVGARKARRGALTPTLYDPFVVVLGSDGAHLVSRMAWGERAEGFNGVAADVSGRPVVTGYFDTPTFDLGCGPVLQADGADGLVAAYDL